MIYKTLHRKLKIEQHELYKYSGVNTCATFALIPIKWTTRYALNSQVGFLCIYLFFIVDVFCFVLLCFVLFCFVLFFVFCFFYFVCLFVCLFVFLIRISLIHVGYFNIWTDHFV